MFFALCACSSIEKKPFEVLKNGVDDKNLKNEFLKICVEGEGRGRIEFLGDKHTFSFESKLDHSDKFLLGLDFPVVGEKLLTINLDPVVMNNVVKDSQLAQFLQEKVPESPNKKRIMKSVAEFFVFSSEFMRARVYKTLPKNYESSFKDEHFLLERQTPSYRFLVDNYSVNNRFYERTIFQIFIKKYSPDPILTLFLAPTDCQI